MAFDGIARIGDHHLCLHDARAPQGVPDFGSDALDKGASVSSTGHALTIHTFRAAGWVPVEVRVLTTPDASPPEGAGTTIVTELSLEVPSGELVIDGIDAESSTRGFGSVAVPAGWVRVRITQHDQDTAQYDGDVGADSYTVSAWPAPPAPPLQLASCEANDTSREGLRAGVRPESVGSARTGALARRLAQGDAHASAELHALAASTNALDRLAAVNACVFAAPDDARAIRDRLRDDPDPRLREQAAI